MLGRVSLPKSPARPVVLRLPAQVIEMTQTRMQGLSKSVQYTVERLVDAGLFTERQAQAYVLREMEGIRRPDAADMLELDKTTVDSHHQEAKKKVRACRETLAIVGDSEGDP